MRKKVNAWKLIFLTVILLVCLAGGIVDIQDFATSKNLFKIIWLFAAACLVAFGLIRKRPEKKCSHCGKTPGEQGAYCPHCGNKML